MFGIFLETFLLSIAKHRVEGQELQVDAGKMRTGPKERDSLGSVVAFAPRWFLHIVNTL
jgi:hypothetical protein